MDFVKTMKITKIYVSPLTSITSSEGWIHWLPKNWFKLVFSTENYCLWLYVDWQGSIGKEKITSK